MEFAREAGLKPCPSTQKEPEILTSEQVRELGQGHLPTTREHCILISFIIPLFNHLDQTKVMWDSLLSTLPAGLQCEAILIDDASSDGTAQWLQNVSQQPFQGLTAASLRFQILRNPTNLGFSKTNNKAIATARGEVLALLNNDLILTPGWLEPMLAVLQAPTLNAGLVGNVQRRVADNTVDHSGVRVGMDGKLAHIHTVPEAPLLPCTLPTANRSQGRSQYQRVFAATGACSLLKKTDFDALGGFDEGFVNGAEDIDLCLRLRQAGKHIYIALQSQVGHHVSLSRGRVGLQNERNSRRLQAKWRPELKRVVAEHWRLGGAVPIDSALSSEIDRTLLPAFAATPHLAARIIAENMLQREECRWARLLDQTEPNAGTTTQFNVVDGDDVGSVWAMELQVQGLRSARNFFVCGHRLRTATLSGRASPVETVETLTITVNGIQQKEFILGPETNFNLGLLHPLVLPSVCNVFRVRVDVTNPATGQPCADASKRVAITHYVLDDQPIFWL